MLRLPANMDHKRKLAIIEDVLDVLEINHVRDVVVGNSGESGGKAGISGGQRKRVNIGYELVAYPKILFLDEPTSGLDSTTSLSIGRSLERL